MVRSGGKYPRDNFSKKCNIQEFSVEDTSVRDGLTLQCTYGKHSSLQKLQQCMDLEEKRGKNKIHEKTRKSTQRICTEYRGAKCSQIEKVVASSCINKEL
jgi:hypothetical protein